MKFLFYFFLVFLTLTIAIANSGSGNYYFSFLKYIPGGDKTGHFFLMGTLCFLSNAFVVSQKFKPLKVPMLKGTFFVICFVLLEEISQIFIKSRTFDLQDLVADFCGILFFDLVFRVWQKFQSNKIKLSNQS
ncbi:VanZ family protein [bacterium]|nr:VanZ family protein [bacterium]